MNFLDLREPVSTWSHFAGLFLALPGTILLWQRSSGDSAKRLSMLVYGVTLAFCYLASTLYHGVRLPACRNRHVRPVGQCRDLRPDRGQLHPDCLLSVAGLVATVDAGHRLGRGRYRHGLDLDRPPLLAGALDRTLPRDGLGRCRLLLRDRAGRVAQSLAARRHRRRVIQRWRRPERAPLARPLPRDLRYPRALPFLRAGGESATLSVHPQGRRAV